MKYQLLQLKKEIEQLTKVTFNKRKEILLKVAQKVASKKFLSDFILHLESQPKLLNEVSQLSYAHDNGFYKLVLFFSEANSFRVRFHFWPVQEKAYETQNIHNHCFNYYSFISKGALWNTVYNEGKQGALYNHYKYTPRIVKEAYNLDKIGSKNLEIVKKEMKKLGDFYFLPYDSWHIIDVDNNIGAITLFIEDRTGSQNFADVFSLKKIPSDGIMKSPSLLPHIYMQLLKSIKEQLQ